jgi:hypothetical protein
MGTGAGWWSRVSLGSARGLYVAVFAVLVGFGLAFANWRLALVGVAGVVGATGVAFGVVRLRPVYRVEWWLICLAVLMSGFSVVVAYGVVGPAVPLIYVSMRDVVGLLVIPPLTVGLLWLGHTAVPWRDWSLILDIAVLTLAGSLLFGLPWLGRWKGLWNHPARRW